MKILLLNLLMTVSMGTENASNTETYSWLAEDENMEAITLMIDESITEKVKIMDANGNVLREILKSDFNTNNMNVADYNLLSNSSHMFDYLGDTYYLSED